MNDKRSARYIHLECPVNPFIREAVTNYCFELGATGISEEKNKISAYFPPSADDQELARRLLSYYATLKKMGRPVASTHIQKFSVQNKDWNAEWKKTIKPFHITDRIMIKPSWHRMPAAEPPIVLNIDPEMAFGTGTHETTRMCVQLLEKYIPHNASVLDIGTGTGILAIAAVKLGAKRVVAFDNDPVAVKTAQKNARINGTANMSCFFTGHVPVLKNGFSIITANINRNIILKILPFIVELLDYNTIVILSGILDSEKKIIQIACQEQSLSITHMKHQGEWLAFVLKKNSRA